MYTNFKLLLTTSHLPVSSGNGSQRKKWQHEFYFSCWIIIVYLAWKWFKEDSTISCVPVFRVSPLPALCLLWFCPSAAPAKKCNETGSTVHLPQPARLSATTGKADRLESGEREEHDRRARDDASQGTASMERFSAFSATSSTHELHSVL